MNKNVLVLLSVLAVATVVYMMTVKDLKKTGVENETAKAEQIVPDELMVDGAPVEPLCFAVLGGENIEAIDIKGCLKDHKVTERQTAGASDEFVSVTYHNANEDPNMRASMVRYKYLGKTDAGINILLEISGGGVGYFSTLYVFERAGDTLKVLDVVAEGDRCNGGIESAAVYDDRLVYNQHVTPFDFLVLADSNPYGLRAYDDLDACPSCCYGVARYNGEGFKGISVTVPPEQFSDTDASPERGLQNCFDKILKSRMDIGQIDMPTEVLKSFVQEFHAACTVQ